jgi:hypothetical protein
MQVWKHMRDLTERDIEKRAVMEVICYFEEQMNMVIRQSARELEKRNRLHTVQGLKQKQRIDQGCIREAIKTINNNGHSSLSKRTGGILQKEKKRDKHPQENTEVA